MRATTKKRDDKLPAGPAGLIVDPDAAAWDAFVSRSTPGSYLQTSAWARVKASNGWTAVRFIGPALRNQDPDRMVDLEEPTLADAERADAGVSRGGFDTEEPEGPDGTRPVADAAPADVSARAQAPAPTPAPAAVAVAGQFGAQLLLRRPRAFPWAFAYSPRGPVSDRWDGPGILAFTAGLRRTLDSLPTKVSHVRIEPEIELNGPCDVDGELRRALRSAGWRPGTPIQPPRTRQIDLAPDEAALWGNLRKKWRQYVNKARRDGVRIVDAGPERLPEFYSIYRETARRAGFVIRTYESYVGVWEAFAKLGMARLLIAESGDGTPVATLFVLQVGNRVVEPYGGMTQAGAESRANYLLKWEAIRSSRERGAVSYDMWGISHEGIEHFKAGFGGREIKYVGAWDLVIDPAGRLMFDSAQVVQDRVGAWRHGIMKVRGRPHAPTEDQTE